MQTVGLQKHLHCVDVVAIFSRAYRAATRADKDFVSVGVAMSSITMRGVVVAVSSTVRDVAMPSINVRGVVVVMSTITVRDDVLAMSSITMRDVVAAMSPITVRGVVGDDRVVTSQNCVDEDVADGVAAPASKAVTRVVGGATVLVDVIFVTGPPYPLEHKSENSHCDR